jgi:RNAse (barnase) inhibitor barstar
MKTLPAPPVLGNTEAERFNNAIRKTFTVSKEDMQRLEAEWERLRGKKTQPKQR